MPERPRDIPRSEWRRQQREARKETERKAKSNPVRGRNRFLLTGIGLALFIAAATCSPARDFIASRFVGNPNQAEIEPNYPEMSQFGVRQRGEFLTVGQRKARWMNYTTANFNQGSAIGLYSYLEQQPFTDIPALTLVYHNRTINLSLLPPHRS